MGFLPRRAGELASFWEELGSWVWPVVAFESPRRLPATLRSLAAAAPSREIAVCRELTKKFEQVERGPRPSWQSVFAEPPKGEITLVIGAASGADATRSCSSRRREQWPISSPPGRLERWPPRS